LPALGPCSQLLYLDLSGHALSGALPALPQGLQFLNLSSNGLSQRLPQLASSPSLQYIDLSFNRCAPAGDGVNVLLTWHFVLVFLVLRQVERCLLCNSELNACWYAC
jgi:hypothetical protein